MFSVTALFKVYTNAATPESLMPKLSWLVPTHMSLSTIVTATLIAVFIYWGWDTAVSVNEETADPTKTPGRAAIASSRTARRAATSRVPSSARRTSSAMCRFAARAAGHAVATWHVPTHAMAVPAYACKAIFANTRKK